MRKNLFLSFIFFSLVAVAFYMEEIQKIEKIANQVEKTQVIKLKSKMNKIILPNVTLGKSENKWIVSQVDYEASEKKVETLINIFKGLKSLERINLQQESDVFKKTNLKIDLVTNNETFKIQVGDVSEITGNFYLKIKNKILLVEDSSIYDDVYSSELDLKLKKYLRLINMAQAFPKQYIQKDLFLNQLNSKLKFAKVDSKRNRWYTLDFLKNEMTPSPVNGMKLKRIDEAFLFYMKQVRIKELISSKKNILSDLASEINIGFEDSDLTIKLYNANNDVYGKFLKLSNQDRVFEIEEKGSEIFFLPYQTYWMKTFQLPEEVFKSESFKFALSKDRKSYYSFKVVSVEDFEVLASDEKVASFDKNLVNFTFNLLLNLTIFTEASYVEPTDSTRKFFDDGFVLSLRLFSKNFHIKLLGEDILVLDEKLGVIYHFPGQNTQIKPLTYERIFTLSEN